MIVILMFCVRIYLFFISVFVSLVIKGRVGSVRVSDLGISGGWVSGGSFLFVLFL